MSHIRFPLALIVLALTLCGCASSANAPAATARPSANAIALTFDTGVDAGSTPQILDTLHREGVRATFSVTGLWAEQHRDLLLAIAAAGHQIINGAYHGTSFTGASTHTPPLTADERALELSRTEVTVYHLTGRSTRPYWRPPHGDIDDGARRDAATAGYTIAVLATVNTADWAGASSDEIVERSIAAAAPNAIYIMHTDAASQDVAALPPIISALRARGLAFGAVEDVLHP